MTTQPFGTAVILLNAQDEILVGKRKNAYKAGFYGLLGGRFKYNEPLLDAALREVEEETGLVLDELTYIGVVRETQEEYDFIHFIFATEIEKQQPQLTEPDKCEGWEWVPLDMLPEKILPGHEAAVNLFLDESQLADVVREDN